MPSGTTTITDSSRTLRAEVDPDALARRTGAEVEFVELRAGA